ncbi:DsbA family protein [Pseudomonas tremae]
MSARLIYVMDPMCSWCWGFAPVADALVTQAREAGVPLHLVMGGLRSEKTVLEPAKRRYILEHWRAVEEATGQVFHLEGALPEGFVYDTTPACLAVAAARHLDPEGAWLLAGLIQQAFYGEGRDVTLPSVLAELAGQAGFSRQAFADEFESPERQAATVADFAWAHDLGIDGFPTLLAERNGQLALLTNGYQPLSSLSPLLGRWLERAVSA